MIILISEGAGQRLLERRLPSCTRLRSPLDGQSLAQGNIIALIKIKLVITRDLYFIIHHVM